MVYVGDPTDAIEEAQLAQPQDRDNHVAPTVFGHGLQNLKDLDVAVLVKPAGGDAGFEGDLGLVGIQQAAAEHPALGFRRMRGKVILIDGVS